MPMPKTSRYKRTSDRSKFNLEDAVQAIKAIKLGNKSVRAAAVQYNVPRSTLWRYVEQVSTEYEDISTVPDDKLQETVQRVGTYAACAVNQVFTAKEEEELVSYAKKCSDHYYGFSINELRELAYLFAKQRQIKYPSNWDDNKMSGRDWYYGFMRRHKELTLRTHEEAASSTGMHEEVASSKPSTSTSCESSLSTILSSIGPVQAAAPANKKSNRGRRAMKSTILTSPESRDTLREKQEKRDTSKGPKKRPVSNTRKSAPKTPAKRGRPPKKVQKQLSSDENGDEDFCIICLEKMPRILSRNNSIACIECKREVHLKCAKLTKSYFICQNCKSE
ncbi:PREDICTED: uncharacterized protein LOC105459883 [Wasmannia auropunctata]|uniref:uncharacterized protein LOC105459883 n=1 Tax=Wasmannia auropunctata TaxID=64793 RepID=UPI0005EFDF09|nr:PREDICTED: uncharacterized protein LOC105459883 [Wasmannia auropunctata]